MVGGVALVIVVALVVALVGSGGGGSGSANGKGKTASPVTYLDYPAVEVSGTALRQFDSSSPAKGDGLTLPTIHGQSPKGDAVTISASGGKQVVVVGAPWCPHCNRELPKLVGLLQSGGLGNLKVTLVVTAQQSGAANWPPGNWVYDTLHWPATSPVLLDDKSATAATALGTPAYPYFVFVDSHGQVGSRATGEIGLDVFQQHVQALR
ncbi:MAG: TlpA family protein disulfide reductase [Actinobacteria bacterium]|nr:TlpA family protein disulfide reductase [Actinomycetota bacterium]